MSRITQALELNLTQHEVHTHRAGARASVRDRAHSVQSQTVRPSE